MTELTSCPSLMLSPTVVTSVTLPSSGLQGSQLETQAGSAEGSLGCKQLHEHRARAGTCGYLSKILPQLFEHLPSETPLGLLFPEGICS